LETLLGNVLNPLQCVRAAIGKIIDNTDVMPRRKQRNQRMASDIPRSSCDKYPQAL
jgi:hypothetical protein